MSPPMRHPLTALAALLLLACADGAPQDVTDPQPKPTATVMRRLSVAEFDATASALLGVAGGAGAVALPADPKHPFDSMIVDQQPSSTFSEGLEQAARQYSAQLRADPAALGRLRGCTPSGADDATCMRLFVSRVARAALRRAVTEPEVTALVQLGLAQSAAYAAFDEGVLTVVEALLQDPELMFRFETGPLLDDDPTLFRLDDWSLATRLAFTLTGGPPNDDLLDAAERGELTDPARRRAVAEALLEDPRAEATVQRLHALWLGYDVINTFPDIAALFRLEADRTVSRVIFRDQAPWTELIVGRSTFGDAVAAEHYQLPYDGAGAAGWLDYPEGDLRSGILAQGAFASVGNNAQDTSPVKRGKLVRERLMCDVVGPPPPNPIADAPPHFDSAPCKADRYAQHRSDPACAACHAGLDGIGFGLENYDKDGKRREFDYLQFQPIENENCPISGEGELPGYGSFVGPAGLAALLVDNELVQACAVQQLATWATGEVVSKSDPRVQPLLESFRSSGWRFDTLLLDLVSSDLFALQRAPQEAP